MKKIFILIIVLFTFTACSKNNKELDEVFQVVKKDRGLEDWVLIKKEKIDYEDYYFYTDSEKNLNLIQVNIKGNKYYFNILYNTTYNNPEDYTYEDSDYLGISKKNNMWKIDYIS